MSRTGHFPVSAHCLTCQPSLLRWLEVSRLLKGWEPTWREMAEGFDRVGVEAVTGETRSGRTRTWRSMYVKDGARCRGYEETPDLGGYEWLRMPLLHWMRWAGGSWQASVTESGGLPWPGGATALDRQLAAWGVVPETLRAGAGGSIELGFVCERGAGRMVWEADGSTGQVVVLRRLDGRRHLEWEERRRFAQVSGRTVMVSRTRRVLALPGSVIGEEIAWRTTGLDPVGSPE